MADINGGTITFVGEMKTDKMDKAIEQTNEKLAELAETAEETGKAIDESLSAVDEKSVENISKAVEEAKKIVSGLTTEQVTITPDMDETVLTDKLNLVKGKLQEVSDAISMQDEQISSSQETLRQLNEERKSLVQSGDWDGAEANNLQQAEVRGIIADIQAAREENAKLNESLEETRQKIEENIQSAKEQGKAENEKPNIAEGVADAVGDAAEGVEKTGELGEKVKELGKEVADTALKSGKLGTAGKLAAKAFGGGPWLIAIFICAKLAVALVKVIQQARSFADTLAYVNEQERINLEYTEGIADIKNMGFDARIKQAERELEIAKAQNNNLAEQQRLERAVAQAKANKANWNAGYRGQTHDEIVAEMQELAWYEGQLKELQETNDKNTNANGKRKTRMKIALDYDNPNNERSENIEKAIEAVQGKISNLKATIKIGMDVDDEQKEAEAEAKRIAIQQAQEQRDRYKAQASSEREILWQERNNSLQLMKEGWAKEDALRKGEYDKQIDDIKFRLKTEEDLTAKARASLLRQEQQSEQMRTAEQEKANKEREKMLLDMERETEDILTSSRDESAQNQRDNLLKEYKRQKQDIDNMLTDNTTELSPEQVAALQAKLMALREKYVSDSAKLEKELAIRSMEYQNDVLENQKQIIEMREGATEVGMAKMHALELQQIEQQRQIELEQNKLLDADLQKSEDAINAKYDAQVEKSIISFEKASGAYGKLFEDMGYKSREDIQATIAELEQLIALLNGEDVEKPEGITDEFLENLRNNGNEQAELYKRLTELRDNLNDTPSTAIERLISNTQRLRKAREELAKADTKEKQQRAEENIAKATQDSINDIIALSDSVTDVADKFAELGDVGMGTLSEIGSAVSMLSSTLSSTLQGFMQGGILGGIAALATTAIDAVVSSLQAGKQAEKEAEEGAENMARAMQNYYLRVEDYSGEYLKSLWKSLQVMGNVEDGIDRIINTDWSDADPRGEASFIQQLLGTDISTKSLDDIREAISLIENLSSQFRDDNGNLLEFWQNLLDQLNIYADHLSNVGSIAEDVFGYLKEEAANAIVSVVENGTDSWEDFRKTGSKAIKELGKEMISSLFINRYYEQWLNSSGVMDAINRQDSEGIFSALNSFFEGFGDVAERSKDFYSQFAQMADEAGWDIYGNEDNQMAGAIKTVTEQTAHIIAGQMNAIRVNQEEELQLQRSIVSQIAAIKLDTAHLVSIDNRLANIERAQGGVGYQQTLTRTTLR